MTQILSIPNPEFRISHYTDLLHSDYDISDVNKCLILTRRGEAYEMLGRIEEAAADYKEAIRVAPNHPDGYIMMGLLNVNHKKNFLESIKFFEKALEVDPKQSRMYGNIASSYGAMGNLEKAQEYLKKQRDYNVEPAEYYYNKTIELKKNGQIDPDHSIEEGYLQRSLGINPLFAPSIHALSNLYNQRKEYDKALNFLSETIGRNSHPDFRNFIIGRAMINQSRNLPALSLPDLLWAYTLCPSDYAILFEIARYYSLMGQFSEAAQFATEALRISNNHGDHRFDGAQNKIIQMFDDAKNDVANLMNGISGEKG